MELTKKNKPSKHSNSDGEFLWLVSLSDLMILLFVFFVMLFSITYKKMNQNDIDRIVAMLHNKPLQKTTLDQVSEEVKKIIQTQNLSSLVQVQKIDDAININIKDQLLFQSGDYHVKEEGVRALKLISPILDRLPPLLHIGIEGHTDDTPIHTTTIEDNWDLSSKRSLSVLHVLLISPSTLKRTVLMAYSSMKPLLPNRTKEGVPIRANQYKNRRVTIRIF